MAYRINAHFRDAAPHGWLSDVVAEAIPRLGDIVSVNRHGRDVSLHVTAVWVPAAKLPRAQTVTMVEAREV